MKTKKHHLDMARLPEHIAIIMDGNGRWSKKRRLPTKAGHKAGAEALRRVSENVYDLGIPYLTVYAFSTENWKRSQEEIDGIMDLLREYLRKHLADAQSNNIKMKIIGDTYRLDPDIQESIQQLEEETRRKTGLSMQIALNYGGRDEMVRAFNRIIRNEDTRSSSFHITEDLVSAYLDTCSIPDPALLIRTSGEYRISNFLLWQLAYTELYFTQTLWPDFTSEELYRAIAEYQDRDRRFGGK